jgi:hypothetical protein
MRYEAIDVILLIEWPRRTLKEERETVQLSKEDLSPLERFSLRDETGSP